jgi:hypothetical protein
MIDSEPALGLPLVDHLVKHRMLDLGPRMPSKVPAADRDFQWLPGPDFDGQLAQPGAHAAGQPDRNFPECSPEVLRIQPMMKSREPVQHEHVTRKRALAGAGSRTWRRMRLDRKGEELTLRGPPQHSRHAWVEEAHDRLQDAIRGKGIAAVNSQNALAEAEHHRTVGMGDNAIYFPEAQSRETLRKAFLQRSKLPRTPAYPLSRLHSP